MHRCMHEWDSFTQSGSRLAQGGGCGTEVPLKDTDLIVHFAEGIAVEHADLLGRGVYCAWSESGYQESREG